MSDRVVSLDEVRADGWFERLGDGAPHFADLCEALGERTVAFAIVAGVRITAVAVDRRNRDASLVTFNLGDDDEETQLPLGELRRRLGATLVADEMYPDTLAAEPDVEEIQRFIGYRYLLLAPIFGVTLRELILGDSGVASVKVDLGAAADVIPLADLRELIRERVRAESRAMRPSSPFAIDLNIVPEAESANAAEDWDATVDLLGAWPGPLSLLLRTREGAELTPDVRGTLARALGLLGTAYVELGSHDWAEEVLRLAIQWGQEVGGELVGDLFRRLGHAHVLRARHGQALGLLRRALYLGAPRADVLPLLAASFAATGHHLPAAVCAREAIELGVEASELLAAAANALGDPWARFEDEVLAE